MSNYGDTEQGVLDLVDATRVSSNTAYAQLMLEVGPGNVATLANRLGVSAELPAVPALVLGSGDVSPLDMAVGYSTFANRGVHNDPILIAKIEQVDEDGDVSVIDQAVPTGERVLSEEQADLVTYCLQEVVQDGTGASAGFGKPAAGKTGTTQDNKDAWFVGYTPKLTAAVWLGYADPLPDGSVPTMDEDSPVSTSRGLNGVTGGSLPASIWRKFMMAASAGGDTGSFVEPSEFPGTVLHDELEPTTTTVPTSSTSSTTTSSTTSTTVEDTTTTHVHRRAPPRPPTLHAPRRPAPMHRLRSPAGARACARGARLGLALVEELVGVAGAAREAPVLDGVEHLHLLLLVPRLGGEVDAVQGDDVDVVVPAAVAVPERHAMIMPCGSPSPAGQRR